MQITLAGSPQKKGLKATAYVQWNASSEVFPETGLQPESFQEKSTLEHSFYKYKYTRPHSALFLS